ncbi:MAG: hypothetical protein QGI61_15215 [Alphaproteobacteria bacterium]|nr:hypothetical protein [Alphaproteobacteria bacterium]
MRKDYPMHTIYLGSRDGKHFLPTDCSKIKDIILKEFGRFTMFETDGFFAGKDVKTMVIKIASDDVDKVRRVVTKLGRGMGQKGVGLEVGGQYRSVMTIPPSHTVAI